ncbi:DoxX family protein [Roseibium sp.]|uniref:DoxX family protein n=1 Tax=Roseibium sp. TaxID=1936156 RepID=UPI003A97E046
MNLLKPYSGYLQSLFRIMVGLAFLQHGTTKLLHFPATKMSGISPMSLSGAAGVIELVCGTLIVAGLFTRPAAFLASGTMAFAYFLKHAPRDFFPINNGGELALVYCFAFLFLAAAGAGPISVDRILGKA